MNYRDRVLTALNYQEPDRCPMQVSFTPEFATRLEADMELKGQGLHNPHGGGNTYDLERTLDEDMLLTSVGWVNGYYQNGYQDMESYRDEWGVTWRTVEYQTRFGAGKYTEPFGHPLSDNLPWMPIRLPIRIALNFMWMLKEQSAIFTTIIGLSA